MQHDTFAIPAPATPAQPAIRALDTEEMRRAGGGYSVKMKDCLVSSYSLGGHSG